MDLLIYRLAAVIGIASIYMLYDVLNKRNIPSAIAYASIVVGALFTLSYYPSVAIIGQSALIAIIVAAVGYLFFKAGQLGAADVIEFAAISLIMPIQPSPYFVTFSQFGLPFILSVFIAAGIVALVMIPLYYLPRAWRMMRGKTISMIKRYDVYKALAFLLAYLFFTALLVVYFGTGAVGVAIMGIIILSSSLTTIFEKSITSSMIEYIPVEKFEEEDIIATNLMKESEIRKMKRKIKGFDRLVTLRLIKDMKKLRVKEKFPVYRQAMPLALPIFAGVVLSLLFGNVMLAVI